MSDILCRWLNEDVRLSQKVGSSNFAESFSNGYLIGELLRRYGLQDDFELFSQSGTSEAKLNNFSRIEPTMALLEVKFDTNMASEMINERPGMATRLLYQLFIALGKKTKMNLTGVAMETMRPRGPAGLGVIETDMYKERLKTLVPRQVDLDFDDLVAKYNKKQKEQEEQALKARYEEEERIKKYQQHMRQKDLERSRQIRAKQDNVMAKIKEATVKIPKPPEQKSVCKNIENFERTLKNVRAMSGSPQSSEQIKEIDADIELFLNESQAKKSVSDFVKPDGNEEYISKIRNRLNEDATARQEREKRRRKVLIEQMKAHEMQEEKSREDILVNRLMRQSQMERRIAVQLMHVRHEKTVMKENRLERERQFTDRRLKDFQDALDREAEMSRQAKIEYAEEIRRAQELHKTIARERAEQKYQKHYNICKEILVDIVDFACKVGEYRELTEKLLPPKVVREWKALFLNWKPLYDKPITEVTAEEEELLEIRESKHSLLDEEDFLEYKNFVGEWIPIQDQLHTVENNNVLGFVLKRLNNILYPPPTPSPEPQFPAFPIKACVLGKFFAGKSTTIAQIAASHRIELIDVERTLDEALEAWNNKELVEITIEKPQPPAVEVNVTTVAEVPEENDESSQGMPLVSLSDAVKDSPVPTESKENKNEAVDGSVAPTIAETESEIEPTSEAIGEGAVVEPDDSKIVITEPSNRAKLGEKADSYLKKGQAVPDALLVDIIVERIRNIPEGTGWILDGFPSNLHQAKILEKALTGYSPIPSPRKSATRETKKGKKSKLAQDPQPPPEVKPPKSGLDVVVLFDVEDQTVLCRAEGRSYDPETAEEYHEEFNPPPDGSYSGLQSKRKVHSIIDSSNDKEQAQLRLTTFQDNWPKLEKWFGKFNVLVKMNADQPTEEVTSSLQAILDETLRKMLTPEPSKVEIDEVTEAQEEATKEESGKGDQVEAPVVAEQAVAPIETEQVEISNKPDTPKSKKAGKKGQESPAPKKGKEKKERTPSPPKKAKALSRSSSRSRSVSPTKKDTLSPENITPVPTEEPSKPPSPVPGDHEWVFVEQTLDEEFVGVLVQNWNIIEETYISSCKHVFRCVREENETIYQYFYETRKNFVNFLKRPDEKQIYVSQWQKDFNSFPEDMRSDDESKAEMHQRVDDLCDRLWDICDVRKEEAETERLAIISEGWLQDHAGLLLNHYISLIQAEVDRFQQTCKMLKDYYVAMEGGTGSLKTKLISDEIPNFARLPLVNIPATQPPEPDTYSGEPELSTSQLSVSASVSARLPPKTPEPMESKKGRIPVIPRTVSGDISPSRGERKKTTPRKERSEEKIDSPIPPIDVDEKLLHDAVNSALQCIDVQNNSDLTDEEAESSGKQDKPNDIPKSISKDRKGKKGDKDRKSPTKSKSQLPPAAVPVRTASVTDSVSEEEKHKHVALEKMKKEYKVAVQCEGHGLRTRVEAIRAHGSIVVKKLKNKAESSYVDLDNWLGKRFLEEMDSIGKMTEVMRQAIENETRLQDASVLEDKEFFIDEDLHIFKTPTPPPTPPPQEEILPDVFTCEQLQALCKHFKEVAPSGLLNVKPFTNVMLDLPTSAIGSEAIPERWMNITSEQLGEITSILSIENEYVNWKQFLLLLAAPFPPPTISDLLEALKEFQEIDDAQIGVIAIEDYDDTIIWLVRDSDVSEYTFDRNARLKEVFFDIFSFEVSEGPLLDYNQMFLYFLHHEDPLQGLLNALSVVSGKEVPDVAWLKNENQDAVEEHNSTDHSEENTENSDKDKDDGSEEHEVEESVNVTVATSHWLQVFNHGDSGHGGEHRFNLESNSAHSCSIEQLVDIYTELGYSGSDEVPLRLLYEHPVMRDMIDGCLKYATKDIESVFKIAEPEVADDTQTPMEPTS